MILHTWRATNLLSRCFFIERTLQIRSGSDGDIPLGNITIILCNFTPEAACAKLKP